MCGGTDIEIFRLGDGHGLSPRVRGNHRQVAAGFPVGRSIPACAGEPLGDVISPEMVYLQERYC